MFSTGAHSKRKVARLVGVSRGTIKRALGVNRVPKYQLPSVPSRFDEFAPRVRALLAASPRMPETAMAEGVEWTGASSVSRETVAVLRVEYLPADPADRLVHEPGFKVQSNLWFPHAADTSPRDG